MKCEICGTDFYTGDGTCPGCGYYCGKKAYPEQGAGQYNRQPQGYNPPPGGYAPPPGNAPYSRPPLQYAYYQTSVHTPAQRGKAVKIIVFSVIIFVAVMIFAFVAVNTDKNYDFGSFTIDLPRSMKEQKGSKFTSLLMSHDNEAGEYLGRSVRFAYSVSPKLSADADEKQKELFASLNSTSTTVNSLAESFKDKSGYVEIEHTKDTLKFKIPDDDGIKTYCHFKAIVENGRSYYLFLVCNENKQSMYEDRFDKYMASFKAK